MSNKTFSFVRMIVAFAVLSTAFLACKDDDVKPTTATIRGVITIENNDLWETWQDSGEVQLSLFPAFSLNPPAGWGEVPDNILGPGVPGGTFAIGAPVEVQVATYVPGASQYAYELTVAPGTYSALALGFRHALVTDASKRSATLGVWWNNPDAVSHGIVISPFFNEPAPEEITVEAGDNVELNFKADFGFVEVWQFH